MNPWATRTVLLSACFVLGCSACSSSKGGGPSDAEPSTRVYFVSASGSDDNLGTRSSPFRTIGKAVSVDAAAQVFVDEGRYEEPAIELARAIQIYGAGDHKTTLVGRLRVVGNDIMLRGLDVAAGISVESSQRVSIEQAKVEAGEAADAIRASGSKLELRDLELVCGPETCVRVDSSTLTVLASHIGSGATATHARGLQALSSSVTVDGLALEGGQLIQVHATEASHMTIRNATFGAANVNHLVAGPRSKVLAIDITIPVVGNGGLLASRGELKAIRAKLGDAPQGFCAGTQGGRLILEDSELGKGSFGSVTSANFNNERAEVSIRGGTIRHGAGIGVNLSQGRVTVTGTRFVGVPDATQDGEDALLASSPGAELIVSEATIESPSGYGVGLSNGASGEISALIDKPRLGGIIVDKSPGTTVRIHGVEIRGCATGSGIVVFDSTGVTVETSKINGCPESGILGAGQAEMVVQDSEVLDNLQYGIAAFGDSQIEVSRSIVRGSPWATFASCTDGSRVIDQGSNTFEGPTTTCL